ncbi:MAG: hypothetical protein K6E63_08660 [Lachnospiraceae bacterium]|nr:hypothetical protein [Lachnospiraceae bacterium]
MQKKLDDFLNDHDSQIKKIKARELSDSELDKVAGGVGGANEATCPKCGKSMTAKSDGTWECSSCNITQILSDAEYIEVLRAAEAAGQTAGLVYPVWLKR